MSTVPQEINDLARRLLAFEAAHGEPSDARGSEAVRVFEKLRATISKFMGVVGFRTLLSRALALAREEVPALRGVQLREDGSLEGFEAVVLSNNKGDKKNGGMALVSQFLDLMVILIGKKLTVWLLQDNWPEISMENLAGGIEERKI